MNFLKVKNVSHKYPGQEDSAVKEVSFDLDKGKIMAFLGPSGVGKTTILRCIAGFEQIDSGEILIDGELIAGDQFSMPVEKRNIGIVLQNFALFPHLSLRKNIEFGLKGIDESERKKRVEELVEMTNLGPCCDNLPKEVSGGQQQRAAIARAIAPRPRLLLMDEPFANLDATLKTNIKEDIKALLENYKMTTIIVTHNRHEVENIAHTIGEFSEQGFKIDA